MIRLKRLLIFVFLFLFSSLGTVFALNEITVAQEVNLLPPANTISQDLFGMHIHSIARTNRDRPKLTPWPSVPFANWRLWDAYVAWIDLEPQQNEWHFESLDKYVELAEKHQVEILLPLGHLPTWASARPTEPSAYSTPGRAAEPSDLKNWRNYIRTIARRYKGRIHYYEIWNEPNIKRFYTGTVEQMVTLAKEAYQILKQVDPSIVVVSPAATGGDAQSPDIEGPLWLDEYLSKGGAAYADVIGYHFYVSSSPETMLPLIARVQRVMAKHAIERKPLWNTESGWYEQKNLPDEIAVGYLSRAYILNWAAGVSRFYWYAWDNTKSSVPTFDVTNQTLKPAGIAYAELQKWLVGSQMTNCTQDKKDWICQLTREDGYNAWIIWNLDRRYKFSIPEKWNVKQVRDLTGDRRNWQNELVEIGPSPLLLENSLSIKSVP